MELDIDPRKLRDRIVFHCSFIAPEPVGCNELTELCSVISKVIEPDNVISELCIDVCDGVAEDCSESMTYVERLGDIGRRILNDDIPAASYVVRTVVISCSRDLSDDFLCEDFSVHIEVNVRTDVLNSKSACRK